MNEILEKLLTAADNHGEDDDPGHTVGDLQDLLRRSWSLMSVSQRFQLLRSDEVENLVECGARGEFEPEDLLDEATEEFAAMEAAVTAAGYVIKTQNAGCGFFWEDSEEASEDFPGREDAVADAYQHLQASGQLDG